MAAGIGSVILELTLAATWFFGVLVDLALAPLGFLAGFLTSQLI